MSKQFLHYPEFSSNTSQQSRVRVPERVPSESLLYSDTLRDRTNIFALDRLAPVRSSTLVALACENPIIHPRVAGAFPPLQQRLRENRMNGYFCDDSVLHGPTTPYTMERVTYMFPCAKSMSPHFNPKSSLCRKP